MTVREPHNNSSRVEREILEILEKADASVTPIERFSSSVRRRPKPVLPAVPWTISSRVTPGIIKILASLMLAVLAAALTSTSHLVGVGLAIASAIVLFSLWLPSRSAGFSESPRWRGRDLGDKPRKPGWDRRNFGSGEGPRQRQR